MGARPSCEARRSTASRSWGNKRQVLETALDKGVSSIKMLAYYGLSPIIPHCAACGLESVSEAPLPCTQGRGELMRQSLSGGKSAKPQAANITDSNTFADGARSMGKRTNDGRRIFWERYSRQSNW